MKSIQSSRKKGGRKRLLTITIVLVVVFVLLRVFTPSFSTGLIRGMSQPVWKLGQAIGIDIEGIGIYFSSKQELQAENEALKRKLDEYEARILVFNTLKSQHDELARSLGRDGEVLNIPSMVLAKPPQTAYDTILLDVGSDNGVREGDYVYSREYIYLGRVMTVNGGTSSARLASSSGVETQAVMMPSDIHLTISGLGGGAFEAELPLDIEIKKGDEIVTRGGNPRVIAIVQDVSSRPSDSFQKVQALSPVNISAISWVSLTHTNDL